MELENSSHPPSPAVERRLPSRKPRADGQRNRERVVQAAKDAFTQNGAGTSLDDIAKNAGVGAGTLYRHFPSREALLAAVYRAEVERLAEAAEDFGRTLEPLEALRAWLLLFIDHLATKKVLAAALNSLTGESAVFDADKPKVVAAVSSLFARAMASGDIRADINPVDLIRSIVGVTFFSTTEDWQPTAIRLVDILLRGAGPPSRP